MKDLDSPRGGVAGEENDAAANGLAEGDAVAGSPFRNVRLSRRRVLLAGVTGVGSAAAASHTSNRARAVSFSGDDHSFCLRLDGEPAWRVDTAWFDGRPKLLHSTSDDSFELALTGALLTGTRLRCDFKMAARKVRRLWTFDIEFPHLRARGRGDLLTWLERGESISCAVKIDSTDGGTRDLEVLLAGTATLVLRSDWRLDFHGKDVATIRLRQGAAPCSHVTVVVAPEADSRGSLEPAGAALGVLRRAQLVFRSDALVALVPPVAGLQPQFEPDVQLIAEFTRHAANPRAMHAMASWRSSSAAGVLVAQAGGAPLPVSALRIDESFGRGACKNLDAVPFGTHWVDVANASYELSAGPGACVQAYQGAEVARAVVNGVFAHRFVVPFVGADVAWFEKAEDAASEDLVRWDSTIVRLRAIPLKGYRLIVRRTIDGFAAIFRFRGLKLEPRLRGWVLVPDSGTSGELSFELASQHLQEESIYSASASGNSKASEEVICAPMRSKEARVLAVIADVAMLKDWSTPVDNAVRQVLQRFRDKLHSQFAQVVQKDGTRSADWLFLGSLKVIGAPLPKWFLRYLTQEFGQQLSDAYEDVRTADPAAVKAIEQRAEEYKDNDDPDYFRNFEPQAVESGPSRLVFTVAFDRGAALPLSMASLLGWSAEPESGAPVRFYESLSLRAVTTDAVHERDIAERLREDTGQSLEEEGVTGLELPYRLSVTLLKPVWNKPTPSRWRALPEPTRSWGVPNNLWHVRAGDVHGGALPMRALASDDFNRENFFQPPKPYSSKDPSKFRASLDAHDRHNLVGLTGSFGEKALAGSGSVIAAPKAEVGEFVSQPFHASLLLLTPFGASFDFLGNWDPPAAVPDSERPGALTISKWEHQARLRRDTSVTVEYKGFLLPLGIPAVLIKRTTREFKRSGRTNSESYRAVLVQRFSIRVEPGEFSFPAYGHPFEARDWFLRKLRVDPPETPPLLPPEKTEVLPRSGRQAFWPAVPAAAPTQSCAAGQLFEFTVKGGATEFRVPLVFVDNQVAHTPETLKAVLDAYVVEVSARKEEMRSGAYKSSMALATLTRGEIEFLPGAGSRNSRHGTLDFVLGVALPAADPVIEDEGPVSVDDLKFNRERERLKQPPFYPRMSQARVSMSLLSQLSGNPSQRNIVAYHRTFVLRGFDPADNKGQVFLRFVDGGAELGFGGDTTRSGGPFAPTTQVMAIAREHGPIGGAMKGDVTNQARAHFKSLAGASDSDPVAKFMKGLSDPVEYFAQKMGDAKIAGCVRIVDVVKTALAVSGTQVPKLNQQEVFDDLVELLRPVLQDASSGPATVLKALAETLEKSGLPASALEKLRPSINAARRSIDVARAGLGVSPTDAAAVGAAVSGAYSHLKQFLDDARNLAENPVALLPPSVAQAFAAARKVLSDLQTLRTALDDLPRLFWSEAMAALTAEVARLESFVVSQPEYRALQDVVTSLRATLNALERAAMQAALDRAAAVMGELLQPMLALQRWAELAAEVATNAALKEVIPLVAAAFEANDQLEDIRSSVDATLDELSRTDGVVDRLNTQLSAAADATKRRAIEDALQSVVQLREGLITFAAVAEQRVKLEQASPLNVVRIARSYLEAYDVLLRTGAELHRHLRDLNVLVDFQRGLLDALKKTDLGAQLQRLQNDLPGLLGDARDQVEEAIATALRFAVEVRNASDNDFKALLANLRQAVMEELSVRLNAAASALLPQAAELMSHMEQVQARLDAAVVRLATPLDKLRGLLGQVSDIDLSSVEPYLSEDFGARLKRLAGGIRDFGDAWPSTGKKNGPQAMRAAYVASALFQEVSTLVAYLADMIGGGNLGGLVDVRGIAEKVLTEIGVPSKLRISYDWRCDIDEFPRGGGAVFRPVPGRGSGGGGSPQLTIASRNEVSLRGNGTSGSVTGRLDAFSLHLFGSAPFLILDFHPITFQAGSNQPMKFDVRLENVRFGQALKFVNELAALLNADSGFYVQLLQGRPGIEVGYRFNKDIIQLAAMTLQNVSFSVAVLLPFDNSATRFKVAVGTRQKPILASVGIYGGGFFAALTMRADTMELIEASFEYGGVTGVEFGGGLARGTCKITAGVYLALGVRDEITGFFCASGALTIASIFRAGGELLVSLRRSGNSMAGLAVYTFSFSIGLVDYSYSVSVSYTKGGGGNMTESADGQRPQQPAGTTADAINRLAVARRNLDATRDTASRARGDGSAPDTADHVADFIEAASATGRLHPGLAEGSAWLAYVGAFADLDEVAR
ncbi:hypothetical protein HZ992_18885 [Rhizobacter sp. AJA081-3]|uniref:hypothetical protein n=1 Tax=Rhizobacter sp. AJA081-3 TaxID=2753607 RepID=UPI001ADFE54A|nr:hypothetical protein [Rhizobacter sp. AJA081-3]QTN22207.1 hypothetical protein HZ992_18885 [Rhizobacter sp. AJA081-3]